MAKRPMSHAVPDDMEIAPGHAVAEWKRLCLDDPGGADWDGAINIFEIRIRRRYIEAVDVLIAHDLEQVHGSFGFAILSIDCLLIETLQGFREGLIDHTRQSKRLIKKFLSTRPGFMPYFGSEEDADAFYANYRCALLHSGETVGDFRVQRRGPMLERLPCGRINVNRTAFHEAIKVEFAGYLQELRAGIDIPLRNFFRIKMNAICGMAPTPQQGK